MACHKPYVLLVFLGTFGTLAGGLSGCIVDPDPELVAMDIGEGCQPLLAHQPKAESECFLPFPSDFYRVPDDSLPSGFRMEFEGDARPATADDFSADITRWRPADGASRVPSIVARLAEPITREGLVTIGADYARSTRADSRTVILEAGTGRLMPHFVDLDDLASEQPDRQAFILRPQVRLEAETQYIVAVQGLENAGGNIAPAPEGFRRLRDQQTSEDPALEAVVERFETEVFTPLVEAGLDRAELQLAWSFTTGSAAWTERDMLDVRRLAVEALEQSPPIVTVSAVFDERESADPEAHLWRRIRGTITVPLFLEHDVAGASLYRGEPAADGTADPRAPVQQNGVATVDFDAIVPDSLLDPSAPVRAPLLYGHGFFGGREECEYGRTKQLAKGLGQVAFCLDWWGMSGDDIGVVVSSIGADAWRSMQFSERLPQAMANWIAFSYALEQGLVDDDAFRRPADGADGPANAPLFAAGRPVFMGISQGHILGGVMAALNPYLERAVLHVGGSGLSHMMSRSSAFEHLLGVMGLAIPDLLDQQATIGLMQTHLDRIDPATWAPYLAGQAFPGEAAGNEGVRRPAVLMQVALGDAAVPNFASFFHARQLGLPHVGEPPVELWETDQVDAVPSGGGLAVYDVGVEHDPEQKAEPPDDNDAHDGLRLIPEVHQQIVEFFETGAVSHPCSGVCRFVAQ